MEISVKIVFPQGFPVISKVFVFHSECLVSEVFEKLHEVGLESGREDEYGLYMEINEDTKKKTLKKKKKKGIWLEKNRILSSYSDIFSVEYIELKRKEMKKVKSIKEFIAPSTPLTSSPSRISISGAVFYEGKVMKQEKITKSWKTKYLRVLSDGFEYSKTQDNGEKTVVTNDNVRTVELVRNGRKMVLAVQLLQNQRTIKFELDETDKLDTWLQIFNPTDNGLPQQPVPVATKDVPEMKKPKSKKKKEKKDQNNGHVVLKETNGGHVKREDSTISPSSEQSELIQKGDKPKRKGCCCWN